MFNKTPYRRGFRDCWCCQARRNPLIAVEEHPNGSSSIEIYARMTRPPLQIGFAKATMGKYSPHIYAENRPDNRRTVGPIPPPLTMYAYAVK
jgi:hypothetical protein